MKYIVSIQSSVTVDAKTPEEAVDQVEDLFEDARKRNCGGIDDEIIANAMIMKTKIEKYSSGKILDN